MGYGTWLSLGEQPLKHRYNVIVSRTHMPSDPETMWDRARNVFWANSLESLDLATLPTIYGLGNVFVIGGAQLYDQVILGALHKDRTFTIGGVTWTRLDASFDCTTRLNREAFAVLQGLAYSPDKQESWSLADETGTRTPCNVSVAVHSRKFTE
jgi:dihydrofolate reductase